MSKTAVSFVLRETKNAKEMKARLRKRLRNYIDHHLNYSIVFYPEREQSKDGSSHGDQKSDREKLLGARLRDHNCAYF